MLREVHGIEDVPLATGLGRRTGVSLGHHTSARHDGRAGRHQARTSELDDGCAKHFEKNLGSGRDFFWMGNCRGEEMVGGLVLYVVGWRSTEALQRDTKVLIGEFFGCS